jgi:hypothetical protein
MLLRDPIASARRHRILRRSLSIIGHLNDSRATMSDSLSRRHHAKAVLNGMDSCCVGFARAQSGEIGGVYAKAFDGDADSEACRSRLTLLLLA